MRCPSYWIEVVRGVTVIGLPGHAGYIQLDVPLTKFPNLEYLESEPDFTRNLIVVEQHMFGDQAIMIESAIVRWKIESSFKRAPVVQVNGSSASSLRRITIGKNDRQEIDHHWSAFVLKTVRENVCNTQASDEEVSLFGQLRSFESFAIHDITLETLSALLQRCPLLTRLAFSQHTLGNLPDILRTAPRLHNVEIKGAALSWLPSLTFIPRLSLECTAQADPQTLECVEPTVMELEKKGDVHSRSRLRYLHLDFAQDHIATDLDLMARFILSVVPIDAEIVVKGWPDWVTDLRAAIDLIRQEDKIAKEEQRERERTGPGFRLIEKPRI